MDFSDLEDVAKGLLADVPRMQSLADGAYNRLVHLVPPILGRPSPASVLHLGRITHNCAGASIIKTTSPMHIWLLASQFIQEQAVGMLEPLCHPLQRVTGVAIIA